MDKNQEIIFKEYSKKWNLMPKNIEMIFNIVNNNKGRYNESVRELNEFKIFLKPRQIRYFYKKVKLCERIEIVKKGKPKNWSKLLERL